MVGAVLAARLLRAARLLWAALFLAWHVFSADTARPSRRHNISETWTKYVAVTLDLDRLVQTAKLPLLQEGVFQALPYPVRITVMGGGNFGLALSLVLARNEVRVTCSAVCARCLLKMSTFPPPLWLLSRSSSCKMRRAGCCRRVSHPPRRLCHVDIVSCRRRFRNSWSFRSRRPCW